jgi:hypothetical protein
LRDRNSTTAVIMTIKLKLKLKLGS